MTLIPDLERDLVSAASRNRSRRRGTRRAGVFAAAAAAAAVALVTVWPSDDDGGRSRAGADHPPAPPAHHPPVVGSLVRLASFDFKGVHYGLAGYRSEDDTVCIRIKRTPPEVAGRDRPTVTCAGARSLRRGLRRARVLNVGGGGGKRLVVSGFARARVSGIRVVGTHRPARTVLTRPWRPLRGARIRAYTIIVIPPRGADISRPEYRRIRAVAAGR